MYVSAKENRDRIARELRAALGDKEMTRQRTRKNVRPERDTAVATGKQGNLGDLAPNPDLKNPADIGVLLPPS